MSPKVNRTVSKPSFRKHIPSHFREHRRHESEGSDEDLYLAPKEDQGISRFETEDDDGSSKSDRDLGENEENERQDWLDGSTLIAQYQDLLVGLLLSYGVLRHMRGCGVLKDAYAQGLPLAILGKIRAQSALLADLLCRLCLIFSSFSNLLMC